MSLELSSKLSLSLPHTLLAGGNDPEAVLGAYLIDRIDPRRTDLIPLSGGYAVSITTSKLGLLLTQASAPSRAAYLPTGLNGKPCLQFDGVDDWYRAESSPWPRNGVRVVRAWSVDTLVGDAVSARYSMNWGGVGLPLSISVGKQVVAGVNRMRGTVGTGSVSASVNDVNVDSSGLHLQDFMLSGSSQRHQVDAAPEVLGANANGATSGRTTYGSTNAMAPTVFAQERDGDTFILDAATPEPLIAQLKIWLKSQWGTP